MSSGKRQPLCLGLNVLTEISTFVTGAVYVVYSAEYTRHQSVKFWIVEENVIAYFSFTSSQAIMWFGHISLSIPRKA